ncbi:MAG: protein translocase subunit SecD, partial [Thermoguttaceae bacterium]
EISITKLGDKQIRIIVPLAEEAEVTRIERLISASGALEFRILASTKYDNDKPIIDLAKSTRGMDVYQDVDGEQIRVAFWIPVAPKEQAGFVNDDRIITRKRGELLDILVLQDDYNVYGKYIRNVRSSIDYESMQPCLAFSFNATGANLFAQLTRKNAPDPVQPNRLRQLGIIMNGEMYSAPNLKQAITGGNGQITFGQRDTPQGRMELDKEINDLISVMNAGSLPADLSQEPVSKMETGATLGEDTIGKGMAAVLWGGAAVLLFMVTYYRLAGLVACFAVAMNFFMIMAVMFALRAAFTLPGIAGLVLTLGMAVDANILIYERIREELANGASLRMAIRNGFGRALSAIVDSNITTLICGIILYAVGNEQIKGFAVTLVLGVSFSMFTSIYICRTIFDVLERQKWVNTLNMMQFFKKPNFNFMAVKQICVTFSLALIIISIGATILRGPGILDIDFVGGVSVETVFKTPQDIEKIRAELKDVLPDLAVSVIKFSDQSKKAAAATAAANDETNAELGGAGQNTHFIINTSLKPDTLEINYSENPKKYLEEVTQILQEKFGDSLVYYTLKYEFENGSAPESADVKLAEQEAGATASGKKETVAKVSISPLTNEPALRSNLDDYMNKAIEAGILSEVLHIGIAPVLDTAAGGFLAQNMLQSGGERYADWVLTFNTDRETSEKFLSFAAEKIHTPYFPSQNTIGGAVARRAQAQAIFAVVGSLVCIVIYIYFRFHKWIYGLAAVVSLIHVVIVSLGCIAISYWVAPALSFLEVEQFKIGLPVIAAFLTIIGYSLNDTIILFDRIREVKGKLPFVSEQLVNSAINQTLSRTMLTSLSTVFVLVILYFFGGGGIHTFSFTLLIGVAFGTYSSVYIAAVLLIWFSKIEENAANPQLAVAKKEKDKYPVKK